MNDEPKLDLDELMDRDPIRLSEQDISAIVAYHRKQRARRASGEKPSRDTAGPKVDLSKLLNLKPKSTLPIIKRRI